ncbi:DUF4012 domain-containing protein [Mycolicibacterium sp. F2034L]|nr:DUF4012 domain-containing protein [Mycolicibacterium sp. F2034L]MCK0173769.1 DUF4012 domain-containing protein [Mycolicibacterium sp. F2034L]
MIAVLVLLAVVAFVGWLGFRGLEAKSNLEQARTSAQQTKDALLQGDTEAAARSADDAQSHAQTARDAAHSIPWNIAAAVPWLGDPLRSTQQITDVVLGLATDVLQPTSEVGTSIAPDRLYANGRVDVQMLRSEEPQLVQISEQARRLETEAGSISDPRFVSVIRDARSQLQSQTTELAGLLENTALAAQVMPSMMGADGPRQYFMAFQTNAEARGTGGLVGGFGILRFDDGRPSVDTLAKNTDLVDQEFAPLDLGPDFNNLYGTAKATTEVRNSNMSPHFPYAAQIWKSMWAQETGTDVNGAIAIDPIALSYILGAVGPITMPDGEVISSDNVVELTESTAYLRFADDQVARKNYLQDIAAEVVKKMTGPINSPRSLLDALGKAVGERRIAIWSADPNEQTLLEQTPLAHIVPEDPAPYAQVVINNGAGNKLDYYLKRGIEYVADGCEADTRMSTVTVRLENTVPEGPLPAYVSGDTGLPRDWIFKVPEGANFTSVRLYATPGAKLESVLLDDMKVNVAEGSERGHPVFGVHVMLLRGKTAELTFRLSEPTSPGAAQVPVQPLVDDVTPKVSVPTCSG